MQSRREFLSSGVKIAAAFLIPATLSEDVAGEKLTILHTNDVHSRLDPFPMDGGQFQGMGGVAARSAIIRKIRQEEKNVLLFDAGDIFQGTPYFNFFKGEPEIRAMSAMGYDAATMGNHDFDAGLENFAVQLERHANFPLVISNYEFSGTPMQRLYKPYEIFRKGRLKIGVLGVGIELDGLVPSALSGGTKYLDPVGRANEIAVHLKKTEKCDMVICLSHLGNKYSTKKVSDEILAKESECIDLIIGGHTHSFLPEPIKYVNKSGSTVIVNQVGWAGVVLGRLDFSFDRISGKNLVRAHTVSIAQKPRE